MDSTPTSHDSESSTSSASERRVCHASGGGQRWIALGAALAGFAVILGAFAAHGLDTFFADKYIGETRTVTGIEVPAATKYLADFKTGATYQMFHSLGLIGLGLAMNRRPSRVLTVAAWMFVAGIFLFSGSLYVLTLTGTRWLGAIAPFGGTAMILGWFLWSYAAWTHPTRSTPQ
ncbi:MAG: DUF423 domain-containing protein [Planctomycetaceae bacterium]